jgi:hypothetical protein
MKIAGLDYSRPEFKTMFANYGLTAIAAVSLEKSILLLIAAIDNLGKGHFPKEMLDNQLWKFKKKPMGDLIKEVKKRIVIPSSLDKDLKNALVARNQIIHHFFIDEYETMVLPNGPTVLSNKLRPIHDFFVSLHSEIDKLLGLFSAELSKTQSEINPKVKKMLKGKGAV